MSCAGVSVAIVFSLSAFALGGCGSKSSKPKNGGDSTQVQQTLRIISTPVQNAAVGEPVRYRVIPSTPGANIEGVELPENANIDSAGVLSWTPTENQAGERRFKLRAKVGDESVEQEFKITASRPVIQVEQNVDPASPSASTVSVDAPLSRVRGAAVQIEPGSLVSMVRQPITISSVEDAPIPPAARVTRVPVEELKPVELGPSGTAFRKPARVQLPASEMVLKRGRPEVQTFDYATGRWEKVKVLGYDMKTNVVLAEIQHFSTYVVVPSVNILAPRVSLGGAESSCAKAVIVRAPFAVPFSDLPPSSINGYKGTGASLADVIAGMAAGQAIQIYLRVTARTADAKTSQSGWILASAIKKGDGKLTVQVTTNDHGAAFLKIPEALAVNDADVTAFLNGSRAHFVFGSLGDTADGVIVSLDAFINLVAATDANVPPAQPTNAVVTDEITAINLQPDSPGGADYDSDCDQAPDAYDPQPNGDPPPRLVGDPPSPVRMTVGSETTLRVESGVDGVVYTWSASDKSLELGSDGATSKLKATLAGTFWVQAVGKRGSAETRFVWDVFVDPADITASNTAPACAIAADAQTVRAGEMVTLRGIGKDKEQTELKFIWSHPNGGTLSAMTGDVVKFKSDKTGDFGVECVADDGFAKSIPTKVTITVLSGTANRPPGAPSVSPLSSTLTHDPGVPVSVTLTASATDPDGDTVTYEFSPDPSVPRSVSLARMGNTATVTSSLDGAFAFLVTAQDSKGATSPATTVKILVSPQVLLTAVDADKDGYPSGLDCNDEDSKIFPGVTEVCGDGIDQNCDGRDQPMAECDGDGDRFTVAQGDCDDRNPSRNPGMTERCDGVDNNCNGSVDETFDTGKDCSVGFGACQTMGKTVCSVSSTTVVCSAGEAKGMSAEICDGVDNDCNGRVDDVTQGGDDVRNCGGCNVVCASAPNSVAACVGGGCLNHCAAGYVDRDRRAENGCECAITNNGHEICDGLDNDCNGAIDEGVGEPFYPGPPSTLNVGVCVAGLKSCQAGQLYYSREPRLPGFEICDGLDNDCNGKTDDLYDLVNDPRNCGGCGVVCASGSVCQMGRCSGGIADGGYPPPPPFSPTQPTYFPPPGDGGVYLPPPIGDGGTGTGFACPREAPTACASLAGGQYCTNVGADPMNCGACGKRCGPDQSCQTGVCMAVSGGCSPTLPVNCGGSCTNLSFDPRHCGACGVACAVGQWCEFGRCQGSTTGFDGGYHPPPPVCNAPMVMCSDPFGKQYCTDLGYDQFNCGSCGRPCAAGTFCQWGQCTATPDGGPPPPPPPVCYAPMISCTDLYGKPYCTDPNYDGQNCGACGRACAPGSYCKGALCVTNDGFDGGMPPPLTCYAPMILCADPTSTRQYCADPNWDFVNCGACGKSCPAGAFCQKGQCVDGSNTYDGGMPPIVCYAPQSTCTDPIGMRQYCSDLNWDFQNCGGCGKVCPQGTICKMGQCTAGDGMYDAGTPTATCYAPAVMCVDPTGTRTYCTDLFWDSYNCGACNKPCAAGTICKSGQCMASGGYDASTYTCTAPMMMCRNNSGYDVCIDPKFDPQHCGGCNIPCAGGSYCQMGVCTGGGYDAGSPFCAYPMSSCPGLTYCVNLQSDNGNCGSCGRYCPPGDYCQNGTCRANTTTDGGIITCNAPQSPCYGTAGMICVDFTYDNFNCGGCNIACGTGYKCQSGACVFYQDAGTTLNCGGNDVVCSNANAQYCANLQTSYSDCGMCGRSCAAGMYCQAGSCVGGQDAGISCTAPMISCPGVSYCVDTQRDSLNCGSCGHGCYNGTYCQYGTCVANTQDAAGACTYPMAMCPGYTSCVNLNTDGVNCGTCNHVCKDGGYCSNGACVGGTTQDAGVTCSYPMVTCTSGGGGQYCANTQSDNYNCGTCGYTCTGGQYCSAGVCTGGTTQDAQSSCTYPMMMCGANCVNTQSDFANCGSCYRACTGSQYCSAGVCVGGGGGGEDATQSSCTYPMMMCGANCVNTQSDFANCGGCYQTCTGSQYCSAGVCVGGGGGGQDANQSSCTYPMMMCGANCVNTQSDFANCGGCYQTCTGSQYCSAGVCVGGGGGGQDATQSSCTYPMMMCGANCVNTQSDFANCGGCYQTCTGSQYCSAGVCVGG